MNKLTLARPARHLDEQELDDAELTMLSEGYPPSSLGGLDCEEVITHMARRLLDALEELADLTAERDQLRQELRDEVGR